MNEAGKDVDICATAQLFARWRRGQTDPSIKSHAEIVALNLRALEHDDRPELHAMAMRNVQRLAAILGS